MLGNLKKRHGIGVTVEKRPVPKIHDILTGAIELNELANHLAGLKPVLLSRGALINNLEKQAKAAPIQSSNTAIIERGLKAIVRSKGRLRAGDCMKSIFPENLCSHPAGCRYLAPASSSLNQGIVRAPATLFRVSPSNSTSGTQVSRPEVYPKVEMGLGCAGLSASLNHFTASGQGRDNENAMAMSNALSLLLVVPNSRTVQKIAQAICDSWGRPDVYTVWLSVRNDSLTTSVVSSEYAKAHDGIAEVDPMALVRIVAAGDLTVQRKPLACLVADNYSLLGVVKSRFCVRLKAGCEEHQHGTCSPEKEADIDTLLSALRSSYEPLIPALLKALDSNPWSWLIGRAKAFTLQELSSAMLDLKRNTRKVKPSPLTDARGTASWLSNLTLDQISLDPLGCRSVLEKLTTTGRLPVQTFNRQALLEITSIKSNELDDSLQSTGQVKDALIALGSVCPAITDKMTQADVKSQFTHRKCADASLARAMNILWEIRDEPDTVYFSPVGIVGPAASRTSMLASGVYVIPADVTVVIDPMFRVIRGAGVPRTIKGITCETRTDCRLNCSVDRAVNLVPCQVGSGDLLPAVESAVSDELDKGVSTDEKAKGYMGILLTGSTQDRSMRLFVGYMQRVYDLLGM